MTYLRSMNSDEKVMSIGVICLNSMDGESCKAAQRKDVMGRDRQRRQKALHSCMHAIQRNVSHELGSSSVIEHSASISLNIRKKSPKPHHQYFLSSNDRWKKHT